MMSLKEVLSRGVEEIIVKKDLEKALRSGKKLRIKHGIDPTGPKIHLGRACTLWKLRAFQDMGHKIILLIGDYTAEIGDASDKQAERKALSEKEVRANMKNYEKQIGKILDLKKAEVHYNSEWQNKRTQKDLLRDGMIFTVAQMIERENFWERFKAKKPIGMHEIQYPILQGYDSVVVKADVELGGNDQLFNMLAGRVMQKAYGQKPQNVLTTKLLSGIDGRKKSTSWGNVILIEDSPKDMYGKLMSMDDAMIIEYYIVCTKIPMAKVKKIEKNMKSGKLNPRDAKADLAYEITKIYHGEAEAKKAAREFEKVFAKKELPDKIPTFNAKAGNMKLVDLLAKSGLVSSKGEARRLISQGGVKVDSAVVKEENEVVGVYPGMLLQVGKRKFKKIKV